MGERRSKIISTVLAPAIQLWLRSQVEQVEDLHVKIEAGDRQILTGKIPSVAVSAQKAVYQGLHLSQIQLFAEHIAVNLSQMVRGKPLRLLEPIAVSGQLQLDETDLQASLGSELLSAGLKELLCLIVELSHATSAHFLKSCQIHWQQLNLELDRFQLSGTLHDPNNQTQPISLDSKLKLIGDHELQFDLLSLQLPAAIPLETFTPFQIDLGSEVAIAELILKPGLLACQGRINVLP